VDMSAIVKTSDFKRRKKSFIRPVTRMRIKEQKHLTILEKINVSNEQKLPLNLI
jgi:hypothetical protein